MIPVKYNVRNLRVRWVTTFMTVLGTALVVWATVLTFGLKDGLEHALRISGDPLDLIVLRKGADNETSSSVEPKTADEIANLSGIARDANGRPLCSAEYITILTKPRRGKGGTANLIVRGVPEVARALRPSFKIVAGRDLKAGVNEIITSRQMADRFQNLRIGEQLDINQVPFTVVGYFESGGSAAESEVWADVRDLTSARRQQSALSVVNLRAMNANAGSQLIKRIRDDEQFKLEVKTETAYFEEQMSSSLALRIIARTLAVFLTAGAIFGAANTMFAAVNSRGREIGTLRAIGFRRSSILSSFLFESILMCTLGGVIGCLATLPFSGLSTGTANWETFSEITFAFRFGPTVLLRGLLMAMVAGVIGGLFPAIRAVRMPIINALRQA